MLATDHKTTLVNAIISQGLLFLSDMDTGCRVATNCWTTTNILNSLTKTRVSGRTVCFRLECLARGPATEWLSNWGFVERCIIWLPAFNGFLGEKDVFSTVWQITEGSLESSKGLDIWKEFV